MKANQFFNKILDKWPVKVGCLIIAIALYLFHQSSLTEKKSFVLPVQVIEEGAVIHTGDSVSNVTVTVKANTEQVSSIHTNQLQAYISLNDISKNGEYTVPVKVNVAEEILSFDPFEIKVKPEYVKIRVENKDLKDVYIEPSIIGEPEHGYEITEIKVNPVTAEIMGPESIVENTKKIYTEKIDVTGLAKKETFRVNFRSINKLITVSDMEPVEVSVKIEPKQMERTFEDFEVFINGLNDSFAIKDGTPVITFVLSGTVPVLENYTPAKRFVTLDLRHITETGEYELPLSYSVPSYLVLMEGAPTTIKVQIEKVEDFMKENEGGVAE